MQHLSGGWIILAKEKRSHKDLHKKKKKKKKKLSGNQHKPAPKHNVCWSYWCPETSEIFTGAIAKKKAHLVLLYGRGLGQFTEIILKIPPAARGLYNVRVNSFWILFLGGQCFFSDLLYALFRSKQLKIHHVRKTFVSKNKSGGGEWTCVFLLS